MGKQAINLSSFPEGAVQATEIYYLVSVGQPYHDEDHLRAHLALINRGLLLQPVEHKKITIIVADSLQRNSLLITKTIDDAVEILISALPGLGPKIECQQYNSTAEKKDLKSTFDDVFKDILSMTVDKNQEENFREVSVENGTQWIKKVFDPINKKLGDDRCIIKRWDETKALINNYDSEHEKLKNAVEQNAELRSAVEKTAKGYLKNKCPKLDLKKTAIAKLINDNKSLAEFVRKLTKWFQGALEEKLLPISIDYLLEELPILCQLPGAIFYPGKESAAIRETKNDYKTTDKSQWVSIQDKTRKVSGFGEKEKDTNFPSDQYLNCLAELVRLGLFRSSDLHPDVDALVVGRNKQFEEDKEKLNGNFKESQSYGSDTDSADSSNSSIREALRRKDAIAHSIKSETPPIDKYKRALEKRVAIQSIEVSAKKAFYLEESDNLDSQLEDGDISEDEYDERIGALKEALGMGQSFSRRGNVKNPIPTRSVSLFDFQQKSDRRNSKFFHN